MSLRNLLAASIVLCPATILVAQQSGNRDDFAQPRATRSQNENTDSPRTTDNRADNNATTDSRAARPASAATQQFIVDCLIGENKGEVAMARIAEQRASSREVKDFAQMMIKDHTQMISQLEQLKTGRSGQADSSSTDRAAGETPRDASATAAAWSPLQEVMMIKNEIGQRCIASAKKEMEQKEGADFDKCFMTAQAMGHQHMLDSLAVFQNHTSADLQQLVAKASKSTEKHLDHAKEIAKNLEKSGKSSSTARRDTETDKE